MNKSITQLDFNYLLFRYINGGALSKLDRLASLIAPKLVFNKNSNFVSVAYKNTAPEKAKIISKEKVTIAEYKGDEASVLKMSKYFSNENNDFLHSVYVHGSIATGEINSYSDFDALVVIKDQIFENNKELAHLAYYLSNARKFMYGFDPIQHHGWFVLLESDFSKYNNSVFPIELYTYSRCIYPSGQKSIEINLRDCSSDVENNFTRACDSVEKKANKSELSSNLYELKCLLSEFMLLPSLYLQLSNNRGVYKKYSFELISPQLPDEANKVFDQVSKIRESWAWDTNRIYKLLLSRSIYLRPFLYRKFKIAVPKHIRSSINQVLIDNILSTTRMLRRKI